MAKARSVITLPVHATSFVSTGVSGYFTISDTPSALISVEVAGCPSYPISPNWAIDRSPGLTPWARFVRLYGTESFRTRSTHEIKADGTLALHSDLNERKQIFKPVDDPVE